MTRLGPSYSFAFLLALLTTVLAANARAQDGSVPAPPAPAPAPATSDAPAPRSQRVDPAELEERGQEKKTLGVVLMVAGAALAVIGTGVMFDGAAHADCSGHEEHAVCKSSAGMGEFEMGAAAGLVGVVMAIVGIPVFVSGSMQVAKARRMTGLTLQPLVGNAGPGAIAQIGFRF
jgi:hypothetical protein